VRDGRNIQFLLARSPIAESGRPPRMMPSLIQSPICQKPGRLIRFGWQPLMCRRRWIFHQAELAVEMIVRAVAADVKLTRFGGAFHALAGGFVDGQYTRRV
jgi:hypothetical protein